uniref:Ground-like domain-containing protein n=1 Tax=Syphacia muris TaxID=451379 RepID=A0A0N5AST9_9BILA
MSSDGNATKVANFGSLFGRKKRINGTKEATTTIIDEVKCRNGNACGTNINTGTNRCNGKYANGNGYIDYNGPAMIDVGEKLNQLNLNNEQQFKISTNYCRNLPSKSGKRELRSGKAIKPVKAASRSGSVPLHINTLAVGAGANKAQNLRLDLASANMTNGRARLQEKSQSANAIFEAQNDPSYLTEALESIAAEQPIVARSIPKHAVVDTTDYAKHSLDNCLFDEAVYNAMLEDSLKQKNEKSRAFLFIDFVSVAKRV